MATSNPMDPLEPTIVKNKSSLEARFENVAPKADLLPNRSDSLILMDVNESTLELDSTHQIIEVETRRASPAQLKILDLKAKVQGIPGICPWISTQVTPEQIIIKRPYFSRSILDLVQDEVGGLSADLISSLFGQMVRTITQIHALHLVHGCLALETIKIDPTHQIYMTSLDLLTPFEPGTRKFKPPGCSLYYASPQILTGEPSEGPENDVWSLGVVLFVMLTGHFPFWSEDRSQFIQMMAKPLWEPPQASIHPELFALVGRMLDPSISTRITLAQILDHPLLNLSRINASITIHNFGGEIPVRSIKSRTCLRRQGWRRRLSRLLGLDLT